MKLLYLLFGAAIVASCSTIVSGTTQNLFIETPKVTGASCRLTDSKAGSWYLQNTPGSVSVLKGDGPMNVVCEKEGYQAGVTSVDEEMAGATLGNIILGGGIGIFVDAASGAAQKYPDKIVVWLKPDEWTSEDDKTTWENDYREFQEARAREVEEKKNKASTKIPDEK